jgi:(2Fe-2S) ferredoxin
MQIFPGCLGACDQAPLCMADGDYQAQMDNTKLNALIDELLTDGAPMIAAPVTGGSQV